MFSLYCIYYTKLINFIPNIEFLKEDIIEAEGNTVNSCK